jgi:phosphoribosylformylglycinamidine synthase
MKARVLIRPKEGILDPQGQTVERSLPALGFEGVSGVRVGRMVELEARDLEQVRAMCRTLLTNPLIEDFEVEEVRSGTSALERATRAGQGGAPPESGGSESAARVDPRVGEGGR